ncbi:MULTISPECIES: hypothetical protein, partial [unclassified Bradyrhizobium]|uniref:hypothetical protein n=1 Tax=unclassified Bradyrhizobium TaxID=2631580 RepID=UPI002915FBE5
HPLFESRRIPTLKHKLNAYAAFPAPSHSREGGRSQASGACAARENACGYPLFDIAVACLPHASLREVAVTTVQLIVRAGTGRNPAGVQNLNLFEL